MWVLLYREQGTRRYVTLGSCGQMSKREAEHKRDQVLAEVNARVSSAPDPTITFGQFVEGVALPFLRSKWKRSTTVTSENRIRHHLVEGFRDEALKSLGLKQLQAFLSLKAEVLSKSMVSHLRWDLSSILKLAVAEGYLDRDPTGPLYTPRAATVAETRVMTIKEVEQYLTVLDLREQVIAHLAIFAGMRPGEILGLQRRHISQDGQQIMIDQRLYRGDIDTPKTASSHRTIAVPPRTAALLTQWCGWVENQPDSWVFPSENSATAIWRDNIWYRHMKPRLQTIGLEWANFQVLRRTHASLGHDAGIDPKTSADQRGHGIGVSLDTYTKTSMRNKAAAAKQLENAVLKA